MGGEHLLYVAEFSTLPQSVIHTAVFHQLFDSTLDEYKSRATGLDTSPVLPPLSNTRSSREQLLRYDRLNFSFFFKQSNSS
jgi:hypothetical protein